MLVFAISFQLLGQADRQAGDHAKRYFSASQQSLAFKTLSISERIEYLLLTCIYTLMDSKDDHIWSLLGLANQICVENYPLLEELEKRHLFSTLLILEVEVGATYGRPTSIQSNIPSFSAQDFRDFSVMSYHLFRLTKIQYRIHDLVVRATNDRHPYDSPVSVIHEELKEWMNGWSMASSNITSSSVLNSGYLLLIGTFLFERTLMRLLDLLSTTAGGVEERQEVATRLIRNCYAIYFEHIPQEQEQEQEASEANDRLIFPFFWTHTHSIFKAVLAIRQNETSSYSGLSTENNITLEKALALHIKFDRSKKLIDASMSLRAS
jgi:hypothetical protein